MKAPRKVLFVQHAGSLGGSVFSLLYTIQALRKHGVDSTVAFVRDNSAGRDLYEESGISTCYWPGIDTFEHTTAAWASPAQPVATLNFLRSRLAAHESQRRTLELVERTDAEVVHLNSVVLVDCAIALSSAKQRFVWHVRESPVSGLFGRRLAHIRRQLLAPCASPVFLSKADQMAWLPTAKGDVIHNFVDLDRFTDGTSDQALRPEPGAPGDVLTILYLGGLTAIKGWDVLLRALARLRDLEIRTRCVMLGTDAAAAMSWRGRIARTVIPSAVPLKRFEEMLRQLDLGDTVCRIPYAKDVRGLIEASDVVAFPSTRPHFARPVVEASAMGRPSVASAFPGMDELVIHGRTGLLVRPGDSDSLADSLAALSRDPAGRRAMGREARRYAVDHFSATKQISKLLAVYSRVLNNVAE